MPRSVEEAHGFRRLCESYISYKNEGDKLICKQDHDWDRFNATEGRSYKIMYCKKCGAKYEYDASD